MVNLRWNPYRLSRRSTITVMVRAVSTSETSASFYHTTWRNIPEDSNHTRRRQNLKAHLHVAALQDNIDPCLLGLKVLDFYRSACNHSSRYRRRVQHSFCRLLFRTISVQPHRTQNTDQLQTRHETRNKPVIKWAQYKRKAISSQVTTTPVACGNSKSVRWLRSETRRWAVRALRINFWNY
jgi:hypothetical protein